MKCTALLIILLLLAGCAASPPPDPSPSPTARVTASPSPTHYGTPLPSTSYILNNSSKKIHKPSCSYARKIAEKNYSEYIGPIEPLLEKGFTRCGHCKP